jgi:hypothetical protein
MKKKEKKIAFKKSDYNYMTPDMPLIGWVWEFGRRSKEYQKYWFKGRRSAVPGMSDKISPFGHVYLNYDPSLKWSDLVEIYIRNITGLSKPYPVEAINLKWHSSEEPDPCTGETRRCKGSIDLATGTFYPREKPKGLLPYAKTDVINSYQKRTMKLSYERSAFQDNYHPLQHLSRNLGKENVVMFLVDISAPGSINNLLQPIKNEIFFWQKCLKFPKTRAAKTSKKNENKLIKEAKIWKSYLMVFDLKEQNELSFEEASTYLSEHFDTKNVEQYGTARKVNRHYDAANAMINGGFRKLL